MFPLSWDAFELSARSASSLCDCTSGEFRSAAPVGVESVFLHWASVHIFIRGLVSNAGRLVVVCLSLERASSIRRGLPG